MTTQNASSADPPQYTLRQPPTKIPLTPLAPDQSSTTQFSNAAGMPESPHLRAIQVASRAQPALISPPATHGLVGWRFFSGGPKDARHNGARALTQPRRGHPVLSAAALNWPAGPGSLCRANGIPRGRRAPPGILYREGRRH